MAKVYTDYPCNLLSMSINRSEDDWYPYHEVALLFMHEALRRDLYRAKKAIENFDPVERLWEAQYLQDFFILYLLPVIELHDLNEDEIFWPYYTNLNIIIPDLERLGDQHNTTRNAADCIRAISAFDTAEAAVKIKNIFELLYNHLIQHYQLEEELLPAVIAENGEKVYFNMLQKVVTSNWSAGRANVTANRMFLASMFEAIGYEFKNQVLLELDIEDLPWCCPALRDQIINNQGLYIRFLPLSEWYTQYQQMKLKIRSIAVGRDLLKEIPPELPEQNCLSCTIS